MAYFCTAVPGDTVRAWSAALALPHRGEAVAVTKENIGLICHIYNRYEGRKADIRGGRLHVGGRAEDCAVFKYDYYWLAPSCPDGFKDGTTGALVPDNHIIGRVMTRLYKSPQPGQTPSPTRPR